MAASATRVTMRNSNRIIGGLAFIVFLVALAPIARAQGNSLDSALPEAVARRGNRSQRRSPPLRHHEILDEVMHALPICARSE